MILTGYSSVSPKWIKCPILRNIRISAQPTDIAVRITFSRWRNIWSCIKIYERIQNDMRYEFTA
jgi:hypothetical protein